jgi:hypothetical protein
MDRSLQSKVDQLKPQRVVVVEEEKAPNITVENTEKVPNTTAENTEEVHVKVCVKKPLVALIYSVEQMIPPIPRDLCPMMRVKMAWLEVVEENTVKAPNTVVENTEKVHVKA